MDEVSIVKAHQVKEGTFAVVIPKSIAKALKIGKGVRLAVYHSKGKIIMQPLDKAE
ncbi:MAG: AbrB/MazE/SpoVT family DNA-binding domain-containing protein [Candidatus Bathyarchaeia archaeon]